MVELEYNFKRIYYRVVSPMIYHPGDGKSWVNIKLRLYGSYLLCPRSNPAKIAQIDRIKLKMK